MKSDTVFGLSVFLLAVFVVFDLSLLQGFSLLKVAFVPLLTFCHVDGSEDFL